MPECVRIIPDRGCPKTGADGNPWVARFGKEVILLHPDNLDWFLAEVYKENVRRWARAGLAPPAGRLRL